MPLKHVPGCKWNCNGDPACFLQKVRACQRDRLQGTKNYDPTAATAKPDFLVFNDDDNDAVVVLTDEDLRSIVRAMRVDMPAQLRRWAGGG